MSQSTNDSYPTALKVAFLLRNDRLIEELQKLVASFRMKGDAFIEIVKMGRTEMQDAVPMTVGQEFHAFAASLEDEIKLLKDAEKYLYAVNMGATAIGTGINVPKGYAEKCAFHLARLTGKPIVPATDMLAATWDQQGFVVYSSALKSLAIKLSKLSRDQSPCPTARIVDHAGESKSGCAGSGKHRRLSCDGKRLQRHACRS
jgi:aspartate ammonia-lyase